MRKPFLFVLLFMIQIVGFGQDCDSLNNLFRDLMTDGKYKEALNFTLNNENSYNNDEKKICRLRNLLNLAEIYYFTGKHDSALKYGYFVLNTLSTEVKNEKLYGLCLDLLGVTLNAYGKPDSAILVFTNAISIFQKYRETEKPEIATIYRNFSKPYYSKNDYDNAIKYLDSSKILWKEIKGVNTNEYAASLNDLSVMYRDIGEINTAIILIDSAIEIKKITAGVNHPDFASLLNNQATYFVHLGDYKKGLQNQLKAIAIRKEVLGESHPAYATLLNNITATYTNLGEYDSAYYYAEKAFLINTKTLLPGNSSIIASALAVAIAKSNLLKYEDALKDFKNIIDSAKKYNNTTGLRYALLLQSVSRTLKKNQKFDSSIYYGQLANSSVEKSFGSSHYTLVNILSNIGDNYYLLHKIDSAFKYLSAAISVETEMIKKDFLLLNSDKQMSFLKIRNNLLDVFQSYLFKEYPSIYTEDFFSTFLFSKTIALNETKKSLQAIRNCTDTSVQNIFQNLSAIKNYLSKQYTLPIAKQVSNLKEKETEAQDIEQQLALKSTDFRRYEQSVNVNVSDVYKTLKPGEAAIEFTSFKYYSRNGWTDSTLYAALILTAKDSVPHWVYLFEEKQLKNILFTVHPNLLYSNAKIFTSPQQQYGDKLYNLIWKKIEPQMAGINTVYYSPSGILNQVALAAIPFNASSKTISSKYKWVQMGSTKNIVVQEPEIPVTNIALMGGISYNADSAKFAANTTDSSFGNANIYTTTIMRGTDKATKSFEYLPATLTEVNSITATAAAASVVANVYTEHNATEEAFKKMDGHSPSVLHIATHGFYLPYKNKKTSDDLNQTNFSLIEDPMLRSGIALAGANLKWSKNIDIPNREDGIVTAYEIAQMDLSKTELVVLSACESGLGDIDGSEGVFGLQRGFKSAGVNKLILTLWQVPDKATMEFMRLFYSKWLKEKKDIRTAFADTQKTMSEKYRAEPYKWAGFVLIE